MIIRIDYQYNLSVNYNWLSLLPIYWLACVLHVVFSLIPSGCFVDQDSLSIMMQKWVAYWNNSGTLVALNKITTIEYGINCTVILITCTINCTVIWQHSYSLPRPCMGRFWPYVKHTESVFLTVKRMQFILLNSKFNQIFLNFNQIYLLFCFSL